MSWSLSLDNVEPGQLRARAEAAFAEQNAGNEQLSKPEAKEQLEAAIQAGDLLIPAVGDVVVNVSLSGHANDGHLPTPEWANDAVSVSVSNATPR